MKRRKKPVTAPLMLESRSYPKRSERPFQLWECARIEPAAWRKLVLVETKPGLYSVVFAFTYLRIDGLMRQASGIEDASDDVSLAAALAVGGRFEEWMAAPHEERH
jgi:hypothetical protein